MRLRPAATDDVPTVAALEQDLFGPDGWSTGSVTEELTGPRRHAIVADHGTSVLGYAVALVGDEVWDLNRIAVAQGHRRAGLGRRMLEEVVRAAGTAGAARVLLEVGAGNHAALRLYEAAGFREIDRRRGYYRDGADALVLEAPAGRPVQGRA